MQGKLAILMRAGAAFGFVAIFMTVSVIQVKTRIAMAQTAAEPQFLMTWQALQSYAPAGYAGKVLPNQGSQISASLELISANGHPIDLSGQTIYWYLNNTLLGGGIGTQRVTFRPFGEAPNNLTLKVELPDYPGGLLIHEINIPVVQPIAVIVSPFAGGRSQTNQITLQALPYFFAVSSTDPLSFTWSVNGQSTTGAENPQTLTINLPQSTPAGFEMQVSLAIQNANDSMTASAQTNLTYQKQP